jgi:hypothetical protein
MKIAETIQNLIDGHERSVVIGVTGVAVNAAEVASGQPDETARKSGERRLSLNGIKDFGDGKHVRLLNN